MTALLLLLLDSRSPAGAHNHSAGMEAAVTTGLVRDLAAVEAFCRRRLATSGRVAASFAAVSCHLATSSDAVCGDAAGRQAGETPAASPRPGPDGDPWAELDAEFEARTPSAAMRASSRQLGRGLLRMVRSMVPAFAPGWAETPHHPIVLGSAVAAAGGTPTLAARAAALGTASLPAGAALRLLGLDPFAVQAVLAGLAREIDADPPAPPVINRDYWWPGQPESPVDHRRAGGGGGAALAADTAPDLDLLADFHLTAEVRLFAS